MADVHEEQAGGCQRSISVVRLRNVIKGDQSGVSKAVKWKGGGDFIYCELMKFNEAFMDRIQAAKTSKGW